MTLNRFFTELTRIKDQYVWHLDHGTIRGHLPQDIIHEFCPLTAVAEMPLSLSSPEDAAMEIGMSPEDFELIVWAIDRLSGYDPIIRQRLLTCLGLHEEA